MAPLLISVV